MALVDRQHSGVHAHSISLSSSHEPGDTDEKKSTLQLRVDEFESKAHTDAERLAELGKLLEHYDALARRLRLQYEVAGILARASSIDKALPLVLGVVGEIDQWDIAIAWVLDDGTLTQRYEWCHPNLEASSFLAESRKWRFEREEGLAAMALKAGELVWIDDFSSESSFPRVRTETGAQLRNALAFPLKCGNAVYGVIELSRRTSKNAEEGFSELIDALRSDIGRFVESKLYETKLKKKRAQLDEVQRIAQLAYWEWNASTGQLHINEGFNHALGLSRLQLPATPSEYLAMVPVDERVKLQAAYDSTMDSDVSTLEVEHTLLHVNGEKRIVIVRAETDFNAVGKLIRVSGTIQDITDRRTEESRTRATERRWEAIFRNSPVPAFVTDAETAECLVVNAEMIEWLGLPEHEVLGRTTVELKIWSSAYMREEIMRRVQECGYLRNFETTTQRQEMPRNLLVNVECVELHGRSCFLIQFVDITARKRLEATLKLTAAAVEQAAEAMVILDGGSVILTVNPAFTRITGYLSTEATGETLNDLLHGPAGRHDGAFFQQIGGQLSLVGHWKGEVWAKRKSGEVFPTLLSLSVIRNENGEVVNYVGVFNDISDQKYHEERLKKLALHDSLTGLPNRSLLMEHLGQALVRARRHKAQVAVLFADLDRFKSVNDLLGHDVGDDLLKHVGRRFKECVRASDLVARLGGDEFVIVLDDVPLESEVKLVAEKIVAAMARPFTIGDHLLEVGVSLGIAVYPEHADDARLLLRRADEALYRVKEAGRNGYGFFIESAQP